MLHPPCPIKSCCAPVGRNCHCKPPQTEGGCPYLECSPPCEQCSFALEAECMPCPIITFSGGFSKCKHNTLTGKTPTSKTTMGGFFQAIQKEKYGSHNVIKSGPSTFFSTYVSGCDSTPPICNNAGNGSPILFGSGT